ncbi:unnamed protein product [Zymoseptoria tritici ST99CH_1E4]|uniref:Uncharacterized protein n=1 Tax=Zymoseptoria tritici ST99CH_1E4 TaxID=1276532 RepID=A0A2H1H3Z6_ZYMTR|nr:unnamed protein product [Zymoseptoria tritici ST99CH_1E4]
MAPITEKDIRVLASAWGLCATEQPKVDYAKLADLLGYKTAASATTAFHNARKKFFADGATMAAGDAATPATPKTPKSTGKKRAAAEDGDAPAETGSAKKRGRKTKAEVAQEAAAAAAGDEDDDVDELLAKVEAKTELATDSATGSEGGHVKAEPSKDDD